MFLTFTDELGHDKDKFRGNMSSYFEIVERFVPIKSQRPRVNKYFPIDFLMCLVRTFNERYKRPEVRLDPYDFFLKKRNESIKHSMHITGAVMSYGSVTERLNFVGHIFLHKLGSRRVSSAI